MYTYDVFTNIYFSVDTPSLILGKFAKYNVPS